MQLSLVTGYSEEDLELGRRAGLDALELIAAPGSNLDAFKLTKEAAEEIKDRFQAHKLCISSLIMIANPISGDEKEANDWINYLNKSLDSCELLGVKYLSLSAGYDANKSTEDNVAKFKEVYTPLVREAERRNLKITFENCPHGYPFGGCNIACTPQLWDKLFSAVPSDALGLEFDPSHLVWLGVDYLRALKDFKDKVFLVHAKDTEIMQDVLGRVSFYGDGWWRYRLPGLGQIDWRKFFNILYEIGFDSYVVIEHEDPIFEGVRREEGILLTAKFLRQFL